MKQPHGTVTYVGRRKSLPGQDTILTSRDRDKILSSSEKHFLDGKKLEKKEYIKEPDLKKDQEDNK